MINDFKIHHNLIHLHRIIFKLTQIVQCVMFTCVLNTKVVLHLLYPNKKYYTNPIFIRVFALNFLYYKFDPKKLLIINPSKPRKWKHNGRSI